MRGKVLLPARNGPYVGKETRLSKKTCRGTSFPGKEEDVWGHYLGKKQGKKGYGLSTQVGGETWDSRVGGWGFVVRLDLGEQKGQGARLRAEGNWGERQTGRGDCSGNQRSNIKPGGRVPRTTYEVGRKASRALKGSKESPGIRLKK